MLRSPTVELDKEFEFETTITKTWTSADGRRYIRGVASGVEEDRDGERCSKNAISKMTATVAGGTVKLTSSHQQDWMTEIGDVVKATHDPETDEMVVDCQLPPEGVDPIADKAWNTINRHGVKLGFSIGGKLKKAYYEKSESTQKRRKVLDEILLRHVMLTAAPAYQNSFAEAVGKTFDGDVDDDDFYEAPAVEKGFSPSTQDQPASSSGDKNAGTREDGAASMNTDKPDKKEGDDDEPKLDKSPERHLACPNCGHEFAADLPTDREQNESAEDSDDDDNEADPNKSVTEQEPEMPATLKETLDGLRELVTKTETENAETVEKDAPEPDEDEFSDEPEVLKMVAASHKAQTDRLDTLEDGLADAFETVSKAIVGLKESIDNLPQGRKSLARVLPPRGEDVEKSAEEQADEAETAVDALKVLNKNNPHYAQYGG